MAEQTTTRKAPEERPQQAETTKREVVDITGNVVRAPELRYTPGGTGQGFALASLLNPGLAKAIGTMMKQDFQRAMLNRIPKIEKRRFFDTVPSRRTSCGRSEGKPHVIANFMARR